MSPDERLDRIEQRLAVLERLVRELAAQRPAGSAPAAAAVRPPPPPSPLPPSPLPRPAPPPPAATRRRGLPDARALAERLGTEEWLGQRFLLAIGVGALVVAMGYLLKLSFEREWISPLMRCVGGVVAGAAVGALGWRLHPRYRVYGASLIGGGAAIMYLSVWAACRLYTLLPPAPGIAGLALVSLSLAAIAWAIDVEALGATAAFGALIAPVLLGTGRGHGDVLLLYLACMGAGLGTVAARKRWRVATLVVAASVFVLAFFGSADDANAIALLAYGTVAGTAGLALGLAAGWWETRFLAFWGGWGLVGAASERLEPEWLLLLAAAALAVPVWRHALRVAGPWWPLRGAPGSEPARGTPEMRAEDVLGEALYFFATPFMLAWAVRRQAPAWFDAHAGVAPALVALPYFVAGQLRPRPVFSLVAAAALVVAAWAQWPGLAATAALLAVTLAWAALGRRYLALGTFAAACLHLYGVDAMRRPLAEPAFTGDWALVLWATAGVAALLARWLWRDEARPDVDRLVRGGLWSFTGLIVFAGVTAELSRHFAQLALAGPAGEVALQAGLSISAWWLLFAALLVVLGFGRDLPTVRRAGLGVAALAAAKVVFHDLASLDALYRIASVLILGVVFLALAYLYHRRARLQPPAPDGLTPERS
ncbi:MAG TPA: DUF2339 domain-containing protein [Gemmatimonadales bacterium]|nr:DUF2339 domain-containing protein [Gemmatimonadales bacterium]